MPQIMTMSSQQTLSAAPLDLRTSTRGRVCSADSKPTDTGRKDRSEVKAKLPVHQQDCMNGLRTISTDNEHTELSPQMTPHIKMVSPSQVKTDCSNDLDSAFVQDRVKPELVAEDCVTVRSQDASASRLPLRKRPYPGGLETQSSAVCSKDQTNGAKSPKLATGTLKTNDHDDSKHEDALGETSQKIISDPRQRNPLIYPYVLYPWHMVPHAVSGVRAPPSPWQVRMEGLPADIAVATHQDDDGDTPLHIAVAQGHEEMVHRLIRILKLGEKDVDIYNNMRQTPLHLSVITGNVDLVRALLRASADPGALDRNGQTALHLCCEYNQASCLSVILSHSSVSGSSCLETRNYEGLSPLHLAVQSESKGLVKLLLNNRADINAVDNKSGRSPLMHAVEANSMEMVNLLIEYGCDINAQSYSGNTALHSACGRGYVEVARTLLKNGADSSLKNYHNDTAVMVAKNKRVTDVLRGKGSRTLATRTDIQSSVTSPQHNTSHAKPFSINGSSSPRHSGCLTVASQQAASHSPFTQVTHSPLGSAAEVKMGQHSVIRESQFHPWSHQPLLPIYPGYPQQLNTLVSPHSAYSAGLPGSPYHHEGHLLILPSGHPSQIPVFPRSQLIIDQSRSSSRSSDQSDVSTMSVNSDSKGESSLD